MELLIDEAWLKTLYQMLISIYQNTDRPIFSGTPIAREFNDNLINICVKRPQTAIFGKKIYPQILQKGAVLMQSIIIFHPFIDGNKRTALISTSFYLHWNGYHFTIPDDADDFTIEVAKGKKEVNEITSWLKKNSKRDIGSVANSFMCKFKFWATGNLPPLGELLEIFSIIYYYPIE